MVQPIRNQVPMHTGLSGLTVIKETQLFRIINSEGFALYAMCRNEFMMYITIQVCTYIKRFSNTNMVDIDEGKSIKKLMKISY